MNTLNTPIPDHYYRRIFLIVVLAFFTVMMIQNGFALNGYEVNSTGNNTDLKVVFTPSMSKQKRYIFDAGSGTDTLRLRLTTAEYNNPLFLGDIMRFQYYLVHNINPKQVQGKGENFQFQSIGLTIRNVEVLEIQWDPTLDGKTQTDISKKKVKQYKRIEDTDDSRL